MTEIVTPGRNEVAEHFHNFNLTSIIHREIFPEANWQFATLNIVRLGANDPNYTGSDAEIEVDEVFDPNYDYTTTSELSTQEEI